MTTWSSDVRKTPKVHDDGTWIAEDGVTAVVAPLGALFVAIGAARKWPIDRTLGVGFKTVAWIVGVPLAIWAGYALLTSAQTTLHDMPPWASAIVGLQVMTLFTVYTRKPKS